MSTSEREAFIRAIVATPDDDAPRLVFADWLDEHGDSERAEFIRLQITLANDPYVPGRTRLFRRERELHDWFRATWIQQDGLSPWVEYTVPVGGHQMLRTARFERGFVDDVYFRSPDEFLAAQGLAERTPICSARFLGVSSFTGDQQQRALEVYQQRIDARADGSTPGEYAEPDEFRRFVSAPESQRLRSLGIHCIYQDGRTLRLLFASPMGCRLRHLDLSWCSGFNGDDWSALVDSPAGLESLILSHCQLERAGLDALSASPRWQHLRTLSFEADGSSQHGPPLARAIAAAHLPRLEALNINHQQIGNEGLTALAGWPGLARLRRLGLAGQAPEDEAVDPREGLRALLASPHWGELRELDLCDTVSGLDPLSEIVDWPGLASLRVLHLYCADSEDPRNMDGVARLVAECRFLTDGLELHFPSRQLTRRGERWLSDRFGEGLVLE